jgi:hypothetical protein
MTLVFPNLVSNSVKQFHQFLVVFVRPGHSHRTRNRRPWLCYLFVPATTTGKFPSAGQGSARKDNRTIENRGQGSEVGGCFLAILRLSFLIQVFDNLLGAAPNFAAILLGVGPG